MSAPKRWRDRLGNEWEGGDTISADMVRADGSKHVRWVVDNLCGPLEPVEPMARVRLDVECFAGEDDEGLVKAYSRCLVKRAVWPLARAEEIAAAFRTLGYTDATVEVVE